MNTIQNYGSTNVSSNYGKVNRSPNFKAYIHVNGGRNSLENIGNNVKQFFIKDFGKYVVSNSDANLNNWLKKLEDALKLKKCQRILIILMEFS